MDKQKLNTLFDKYICDKCSADEIRELMQYFDLDANEGQLKHLIMQQFESPAFPSREEDSVHARSAFDQTDKALQQIFANERRKGQRFIHYRWLSIAAVVLVALTIGFLFVRPFYLPGESLSKSIEIPPGGNNAILRSADGKELLKLSSKKEGIVIKKGELFYQDDPNQKDPLFKDSKNLELASALYTIETPRGGQYQIILSDGTHVWLNAASSLTYPSSFTGNIREVSITGEVYFDVAKNKDQPFIVKVNGVVNSVTGTSFNISAYSDEQAMRTTLVTGGLRVIGHQKEVLLKPGQQAVVSNKNMSVSSVNTDEYTAWLNNEFSLENKDLKSIMKEVSRWYNVDVFYEGGFYEKRKFAGTYTRTKGLSALLSHLEELSGINFSIEEGRVIVKL